MVVLAVAVLVWVRAVLLQAVRRQQVVLLQAAARVAVPDAVE